MVRRLYEGRVLPGHPPHAQTARPKVKLLKHPLKPGLIRQLTLQNDYDYLCRYSGI
jgi:hypothetical protein